MDVDKLSDEELVSYVREGHSEDYAEIVRRYQEKLLRYARYLTGGQEEAKDVVQEGFIKAYKNLYGFEKHKKFSSWIYRIVHNEAINLIKKNKKVITGEKGRSILEIEPEEDEVLEKMEEEEMKEVVRSCVSRLPLKYREVVALYYMQEKSYEEISDILRIPIGTVGTQLRRGRNALVKLCRTEGINNE